MTRARCVRMDAVRVAASALLLTMVAASGCGRAKHPPESPPPPPAATVARVVTLRIGLPSPRRGNLLFTCGTPPAVHITPQIGSAIYRADTLDTSGRRWLRVPWVPAADTAGALAPDTLLVRAFGDATDEEIALERGELDVAVFWPGELSARMRADERFRSPELGVLTLGVLACTRSDSLGAPRADMEMLNREAFGGDLLPWSELAPDSLDGPPARYVVDSALPGAQHLERILARIPSAGVKRTLRLTYLSLPPSMFTPPAPVQPVGIIPRFAMADAYKKSYRPLFAIRCPVVARPGSRAAVRAIGASAFAEMTPCSRGPATVERLREMETR